MGTSNPHLSYLREKGTVWFNPCYGLIGFWNEYRMLAERLHKPHEQVWNHRDLKRAKEIYAISVVAKVLEKQENAGKWWILKPKNDPPDGVIGTMVETDGVQHMHVREVEVVEHLSGSILDTLRKKLSQKQYEPNTILVCFVSSSGVYDFEKEFLALSQEATSLDHIFLVFLGSRLSDIATNASQDDLLRSMLRVSSIQIKPVYSFANIDPITDCDALREGKEGNFFIFEGLGRGGSRPITLDTPPKLF